MREKLPKRYLSCMITRARVEGMSCQHCVRAVFTALAALDGIARADVKIGAIEIEHEQPISLEQLRDAVAVAGYRVVEGHADRRVLPLL
jgi:copper chaperone